MPGNSSEAERGIRIARAEFPFSIPWFSRQVGVLRFWTLPQGRGSESRWATRLAEAPSNERIASEHSGGGSGG